MRTMNKTEAFSVLMAVYAKENPEHFRLALQSNLVEQTLLPNEMILVCDGPLTPALDAVIAEYQEKCPDILRVHRLKENGGLGNALNFGLKQCQYEWVARSDSDDVCDEQRFELQMQYLQNHPDVDILGTCIDEFEEDWRSPARKKTMPSDHESIVKMGQFRNPINHMSVVFRKAVILEAGSYQHLPYMEDYDLWIRALCNGAKVENLPQYLVHARVGNGMVQRRGNRQQIASRRILDRHMLKHGMISYPQHWRNMLAISAFVYAPGALREWIYKTVLRKA